MVTHKVLFLPYNVEVDVADGHNLARAAISAGVHINASCGGEGVCGKCRIKVEEGQVEGGGSAKLIPRDVKNNFRLACKSRVNQDVVIRVPVESEINLSVFDFFPVPKQTAKIVHMNLNDLKERGLFVPVVEKIFVQMAKPDSSDQMSDVTRIVEHLKNHFGVRQSQVNLPVIRKIPDIIRKSGFCVTVTLLRPVRSTSKTQIINIQSGDTTDQNFAIAMDIGTTTIYGQLLDLKTGDILTEHGSINRQVSYGEDVISRIIFAEREGGLLEINTILVETINSVIADLIRHSGVDVDDVSTITFAGNTTMTQIFLKINPHYIRISPYVTAATLYPPIPAEYLGVTLNNHVTALVYPVISSYVGGDVVAGVMGSGMYMSEVLTLFMDVGTNAEIVIGNRDWLLCAACSAGPAFEGGGIEFGIRATAGAIEDFSIDPFSFEPMIMTIGDVRPKGICGSGLIAIVATMFEMGVIDNVGKFNRELSTPRIRQKNGIYEYVLAWTGETQIDRDIAVTEIDIDNLIRAKGAIFSGCMSLLDEVGMTVEDIDHVIIAGGFGSYVDLEKAMAIGLLPEIDPEKVTFVGNSSLMGAKMSSLTNRIRQDVGDVVRKMTNCELSEVPSYMDNYVASLFLPHTDVNLFPNLNKRLKSIRKMRGENKNGFSNKA